MRLEIIHSSKITEKMVQDIASQMRQVELLEAQVLYPSHSPVEVIWDSILISEFVYGFTIDGQAAGIFGLNLQDNGWNKPWMISTDEVRKVPKEFMKAHGVFLDGFRNEGAMYQYVHKDNELSRRYLKHFGFTDEADFPQFAGTNEHMIRMINI